MRVPRGWACGLRKRVHPRAPPFGGIGRVRCSNIPNQLPEFFDVVQVALDRGEAHVGHFVQARELAHHQFADARGGDLACPGGQQLVLNARDGGIDLLNAERALLQRQQHRRTQLGGLKVHARTALLHHRRHADFVVTDEDMNIRDWKGLVWAIAARRDPVRDTTLVAQTAIDYLDFASPTSGLGGKMGLHAANKWPGETAREWGRPIRMDSAVEARVSPLVRQLVKAVR